MSDAPDFALAARLSSDAIAAHGQRGGLCPAHASPPVAARAVARSMEAGRAKSVLHYNRLTTYTADVPG